MVKYADVLDCDAANCLIALLTLSDMTHVDRLLKRSGSA